MTNTPINDLAARFALLSAMRTASDDIAATLTANRFSDDDLDYFPAMTAILAICSTASEYIFFSDPRTNSDALTFIAELNTDDNFKLDASTYAPHILHLFIDAPDAYDDDEIDSADILERQMMIDAYNNAFANLNPEMNLLDLTSEFAADIDSQLMNIRNAFANAHRAIYPNSYSSNSDAYPSSIILNPNPYSI